jgi:branched-chain amino acid transport system substrate-binding protein
MMNDRSLRLTLILSAIALSALVGCKDKEAAGGAGTGPAASTGPAAIAGRELPTAEGNKAEGDTIKIGMIASLNGEQQPWGIDSKNGAQLAVDEFNKAGGIGGKKVQLIVEDTGSKPEGGKSATEKLVGEDKVLAVIGEVASGITLPAAQVCQENGVPIVAVGATRVDVTQTGGAVFRACFTDNFQGAAIAKFAYDELKLRKVAIMTDQKLPYSTGLSEVFRKAFTSMGGEIVDEQKYQSGDKDFKGQLTNIKAKNPDGLFCSGYFTEVGPIARQKQVVGLNVPMFGGDGWDSTELITSGGEGIIGSYFLNHYHNSEQRPEVQSFVANFQAAYGHPPATAMGALGYDATGVVLNALKNAASMDSKSLLKAISETKGFKGVSGSITIGPDGNAEKPALMLQVKKDGFKAFKQVPFFKFEG